MIVFVYVIQKVPESKLMHIDEFIDGNGSNEMGKNNYPRFFFTLRRLPAVLQCDFNEWISQYKLYCTCGGKRYRVTGCSRLGDVWLAKDFNQSTGYDFRVDVTECSDWSDKNE